MNLRQHRELQGTWHELGGQQYYFFNGTDTYGPAKANLPGFWTGGEGLAHPVKDRSDKRFVVKSFSIECLEREQRMKWLCEQGLCHCGGLPLLRGAPHKFIGPPTLAQLAPFIEGRTWEAWKCDWRTALDTPNVPLTPDQRLWLACGLAEAVRLLEEGLSLCHSDLAPKNIIFDYHDKRLLPTLSLIDFDAFYHPAVPVLPVGKGQTLGTPGYQAPEFARANRIIRTDRLALAVLIHEFLAYGEDPDLGDAGEYRFFDQEEIGRAAAPTPRFKTYWGETVDALLRRALTPHSIGERPSAEEWCDAFLRLGVAPLPSVRLLMTAERDRQRRRYELQSSAIDLSKAVDSRLSLQLHRNSVGYEIHCADPKCLAILHDGQTGKCSTLDHQARPIRPSDRITVAGWELRFDPWDEVPDEVP